MDNKPQSDDYEIICYANLDSRVSPTGNCRHTIHGQESETLEFAGLCIARYPGDAGFYLFYCDENWEPITDTWHQSVDDAKHQAEFEFEGIRDKWLS